MKIHHLSAATKCPTSAKLVNGSGGLFDAGKLVCHCWLVEANDGLILVDTGIGTQDLTGGHPRRRGDGAQRPLPGGVRTPARGDGAGPATASGA
ncbi:MAG: hypothetical protein IT380_21855 [Myxococcales bacterium]|nr:hypothetical protein [Myxococcales bacterium]